MARGEHGNAAGVDFDDGVYRFAAGDRVILAHAQPGAAPPVDDAVGIAQRGWMRSFGRERARFGRAGRQRIEPLVREMREVEDALRYGPRSAAVFVNPGARVERRRGEYLLAVRWLTTTPRPASRGRDSSQ